MNETNTDLVQWVHKTDDKQNDPNFNESLFSKTTIDDLSEYDLIKIFGYFTLKERIVLSWVNTKWRQTVHNSFLSETKLEATAVHTKYHSVKLMSHLIQKLPNVRHISLVGVSYFKNFENIKELMATIVANCPQLESINFGDLEDFEELFKEKSDFFLKLRKIVSSNMSEETLNCIIGSNNLESFDINKNERISKLNFKYLGPEIREIHLIETQISELNVIKDLCEGNGRLLEILSIDIKDKSFLPLICNNLKNLKKIKIRLYSENCDFNHFKNLTNLKSLQIGAKYCIFRNEEFVDLIRALKVTPITDIRIELSSLNSTAVTDQSLEIMRTNCQFIEKLEIRNAHKLTGSGMYNLAQMSNLKHLSLKRCIKIDNKIKIVITSCPLLRELILHSCPYITNTVVNTFIDKVRSLPKQQFLLDLIDTNISIESLPQQEFPNNLNLLINKYNCSHSSLDEVWPNDSIDGYSSGEEYLFIDLDNDSQYDIDSD